MQGTTDWKNEIDRQIHRLKIYFIYYICLKSGVLQDFLFWRTFTPRFTPFSQTEKCSILIGLVSFFSAVRYCSFRVKLRNRLPSKRRARMNSSWLSAPRRYLLAGLCHVLYNNHGAESIRWLHLALKVKPKMSARYSSPRRRYYCATSHEGADFLLGA